VTANPTKVLEEAREFHGSRQTSRALTTYRRYLSLRPKDAQAWSDLGGLLLELNQPQEAREACGKAVRLDRSNVNAHVNLANALTGLGRHQESEAICREVLARHPRLVDARLALARCLDQKGDGAQACSILEALLSQDPANPPANSLLVKILAARGEWAAFGRVMHRFIDLQHHPPAIDAYERGLLDLRLGSLPGGWAGYESRLHCPGLIGPERNFPQDRWDGGSFQGKTLLVHYEQGLGDTFMFVRYAAQVKALGGRVVLAVQPALADVVATCPGVDEVVPHGTPLPPFDLQIPLLSLPWIFQTDLQSIPAEVPYLGVPERVPNRQRILNLLSASEDRIRIGLAWAGSPGHARDRDRSIPPAFFAPLASLPGVAWHSFQLGAKEAPPLPGLVSLDPSIRNFSDTAYALTGMQLVITVDTALAHLAGALGIPTILLVAFFPDFRWLMGREDSPWYPTLRIYRQSSPGDWAGVVQRLLADLQEGA
jgi:tetratricopeptide (TPR) repeat protein